ncbi:hypothetical protein G647_10038 [Cladophialophora carrionii CBS 160.54]|uniref:Uncharacterized protein n=1 Tax=Cladophialophora carrionii CBS 160.54 TaxID=1279043 RepID=V9DJ73_9EURO|nr:uncharacterized protein G647_10038 [Cladophialophora carrionii CBS 160.54]ETI26939.1 hypothetical protein G647_10038 [Cladophialophora carrionii CBS 160.54]
MFLKQYNYKPRSNSQSSQGSGGSSGSPPKEEPKTTESNNAAGKAAAAAAGRRRSSASDKFAGLTAMKRGSQDERKASWTEQKAGTGILGGMWQNFTKGPN